MPERTRSRGPARHELPAIDELALIAARHGDRMVDAARGRGAERWLVFLEPLPDRLRDDDLTALRSTALRARAAYGPKDSVRDVLPAEVTEPFLDAIDRLLREINRAAARG
jgi:NifB/MoaA-like Fe-S oxidoreductase